MSKYREIIENVLSVPVQVVEVDVEKEFIYLDKTSKGWKLTITKSLVERKNVELYNRIVELSNEIERLKLKNYCEVEGISP